VDQAVRLGLKARALLALGRTEEARGASVAMREEIAGEPRSALGIAATLERELAAHGVR
jgi:hypothetical protein